jgi:hypothetical protein
MYLYHVLFVAINIYGIHYQKREKCLNSMASLMFAGFQLTHPSHHLVAPIVSIWILEYCGT